MKQFFYTRKETLKTENEIPLFKEYKDSFSIDKVIRSITLEDDGVLVLLDDLHERTTEVPDIDPKTKRFKGMIKKREIFQSEITLSKEDGERFYNLTHI